MAAAIKHPVKSSERETARQVSQLIARLHRCGGRLKLVVETPEAVQQEVAIDAGLVNVLQSLADLVQGAEEVSMFGDDPELSPEQASEFLGVSRPTVVRRIKCGDLKARMVGAHHRIAMSDLLSFREQEAQRETALAEFSDLTDELVAKHER
jgi:excisionase family DNA binding protein